MRIRAIDFRHDGLQHRRARRHLYHSKSGIQVVQHPREGLPGCNSHLVARAHAAVLANVLVQQLDLHLGLPRVLAHVVVTHHSVEIERLRRADIGLHSSHFLECAEFLGDASSHVRRVRQGCPFRHVENDREFRLVVQWQHLDCNGLEVKHRAGQDQQAPERQVE